MAENTENFQIEQQSEGVEQPQAEGNISQFGTGIPISLGFDLGAKKLLDQRGLAANVAERDNISPDVRANGLQVWVEDVKKLYVWSETENTWIEIGGQGATEKAIHYFATSELWESARETMSPTVGTMAFVYEASTLFIYNGEEWETVSNEQELERLLNKVTGLSDEIKFFKEDVNPRLYNLEAALRDVECTYSSDVPTSVAIGGIKVGETFDNVPLKTIIDRLLHPSINPTLSVVNNGDSGTIYVGYPAILEFSVVPTKKTGDLTLLSCSNNCIEGEKEIVNPVSGRSYDFSGMTNGIYSPGDKEEVTFTLKAADGGVATHKTTIYWIAPTYANVLASGVYGDTTAKATKKADGTWDFPVADFRKDPELLAALKFTEERKYIYTLDLYTSTYGRNLVHQSTPSLNSATVTYPAHSNKCLAVFTPGTLVDVKDPNGFSYIQNVHRIAATLEWSDSACGYNIYVLSPSTQANPFKLTWSFK